MATTIAILEQALADDFEDLATHQAYADALIEQGDPRGELIQLQLTLESPAIEGLRRRELEMQVLGLLAAHQGKWLGPDLTRFLGGYGYQGWRPDEQVVDIRFARGWLHTVQFHSIIPQAAHALAKAPIARFLRRLEVHRISDTTPEINRREPCWPPEGGTRSDAWVSALPTAPFRRHLRTLVLGVPCEDEGVYHTEYSGSLFAEVVRQFPDIEEVRIYAHAVGREIFALPLPQLRTLTLFHGSDYHLETLASNPTLASLESLCLHPHVYDGDDDERSHIKLSGLQALVASPTLRNLQHVALHLTQLGDAGIEAIVASGVLKRWKTLDLSLGNVSDRGAAALAGCPDARRLERIDLSQNRIGPTGIAALEAAGVRVDVSFQYEEEEDDEGGYLYEGDIE